MTRARWLVFAAALAACNADVDPPWQLAHDRIIAVRAEPPRILAGQRARLDVLLGFSDRPVAERGPDFAAVVSPTSLDGIVTNDAGSWIVTAPGEDQLATARAELGLTAGAPVPLRVGVAVAWPTPVASPDGMTFAATKVVWLGDSASNPSADGVLVGGAEPGAELVVPRNTQVTLWVEADDRKDIVNWLGSCGELHDFDLPSAYLVVGPDDPQQGELALVLRDGDGGVTWRVWPIRAE